MKNTISLDLILYLISHFFLSSDFTVCVITVPHWFVSLDTCSIGSCRGLLLHDLEGGGSSQLCNNFMKELFLELQAKRLNHPAATLRILEINMQPKTIVHYI